MMDVWGNCLPGDVLVVEDDPLIALDFEDTLLGFGVRVIRIAANVTRALQLIEERPPELALLDFGLASENSLAVAERLEALGIPFVLVTGYGAEVELPPAFVQKPRLSKPYTTDALRALLSRAGTASSRRCS
jgi:CheY-like chemotaxis protein